MRQIPQTQLKTVDIVVRSRGRLISIHSYVKISGRATASLLFHKSILAKQCGITQRYTEITANTAPIIKVSINNTFPARRGANAAHGTSCRAALPHSAAVTPHWHEVKLGSPLGQRQSVYASGVTGITDTPGSCAACTPPAPPARGTACRCWRVWAGCNGCDGAGRPESTASDTGPRMTTSIPRSPAAFLQDMQESWGSVDKRAVWKQSVKRLFMHGQLTKNRPLGYLGSVVEWLRYPK